MRARKRTKSRKCRSSAAPLSLEVRNKVGDKNHAENNKVNGELEKILTVKTEENAGEITAENDKKIDEKKEIITDENERNALRAD